MASAVDWYFQKDSRWQQAFQLLRNLALDSGLTEELKWGHPCYTLNGKNVFLIHGFKDYCALLFHKGGLLKDDLQLLVQQTKNVQSARQMRFSSETEVRDKARTIVCYMQEAIDLEKAGVKVALKSTDAFEMPAEFAMALAQMSALRKAFSELTPGRQRGYLLHFSAPKQAATREARIQKHMTRILEGKGLKD
jgi:uncharacterized protein YdeI (YjbR/CyaY-like superfamily)